MFDQEKIINNIESLRKEVKYSTVDYPIEFIVSSLKNGRFFIPEYQREYVWNNEKKSKFIESILIGIPIPFLFLYREKKEGYLEIVDGAQRIQSLEEYCGNKLNLINLDKLVSLNGSKFEDLPKKYQETFLTTPLRMTILDEETTLDSRREIFKRLNTTSEKLKSSEIRKGSLEGTFSTFISECAKEPVFIEMCKVTENKSKRREEEELISRFFAYSENLENYNGKVSEFIYNYVETKNKSNFNRKKMYNEFINVFNFLKLNNVSIPKKNKKSISRARFEAISIGANLALKKMPSLKDKKLDLSKLESNEFEEITSSDGANNRSKLEGRIYYVRDLILSKGEK